MTKLANLLTIASLALPFLAACGDEDGTDLAFDLSSRNAVAPAVFFQTQDGSPVDMDTAMSAVVDRWYPGGSADLYKPDGMPMTWYDVLIAGGEAQVACVEGGTHVRIEAEGLVPNGVYTGWLAIFSEPGFAEQGLLSLQALAPLGEPDGSTSEGVANPYGRFILDAVVPPGVATVPMMAEGDTEVPGCLMDAYEVHLVLAYHQDGETCGDNPCAFPTYVEHVAWVMLEGDLL